MTIKTKQVSRLENYKNQQKCMKQQCLNYCTLSIYIHFKTGRRLIFKWDFVLWFTR